MRNRTRASRPWHLMAILACAGTVGAQCGRNDPISGEDRQKLRAEVVSLLEAVERGDGEQIEESVCLDVFGPRWVEEKQRFGQIGDADLALSQYRTDYRAGLEELLGGPIRPHLDSIDVSRLEPAPEDEAERFPTPGHDFAVRIQGVVGIQLRGRAPLYWSTTCLDDRWCLRPIHLP